MKLKWRKCTYKTGAQTFTTLREDRIGLDLYREDEANYPYVLGLSGINGGVAYFRRQEDAKEFAESFAQAVADSATFHGTNA